MRCKIEFSEMIMLMILFFITSSYTCHGLSTNTNTNINTNSMQVRAAQSASDITALATLRYNEWMMDHQEVSRDAFTAATYELFQERSAQQSIVFLAMMNMGTKANKGSSSNSKSKNSKSEEEEPAGAIELSPIELDQVVLNQGEGSNSNNVGNNHHRFLYATDLVTASQFRRQGVAAALMNAAEQRCFPGHLLLHVEPNNSAALMFYDKLGYRAIEADDAIEGYLLDLGRLTENAGTEGQLLLAKSSLEVRVGKEKQSKISGMGFGSKIKSSVKPGIESKRR